MKQVLNRFTLIMAALAALSTIVVFVIRVAMGQTPYEDVGIFFILISVVSYYWKLISDEWVDECREVGVTCECGVNATVNVPYSLMPEAPEGWSARSLLFEFQCPSCSTQEKDCAPVFNSYFLDGLCYSTDADAITGLCLRQKHAVAHLFHDTTPFGKGRYYPVEDGDTFDLDVEKWCFWTKLPDDASPDAVARCH